MSRRRKRNHGTWMGPEDVFYAVKEHNLNLRRGRNGVLSVVGKPYDLGRESDWKHRLLRAGWQQIGDVYISPRAYGHKRRSSGRHKSGYGAKMGRRYRARMSRQRSLR